MATAFRQIEPSVEEIVGALVEQTVANPVAVFTDEAKFSDFYSRLKDETDRHIADLSTAGGRKAIASLAFRVTKAKTSLDKAGLGLTEEWRSQIALVNASRKKMTSELDQLAADVRWPLTEWEEREAERVAQCEAVIAKLREAAVVTLDDTVDTVIARGSEVYQTVIDPALYGLLFDTATAAREQAMTQLLAAKKRLQAESEERERAAAERAELEQLRAENAAREQAAREAEEARQAMEREEIAAREAEERRIAAEQAEAQRIRDAEKAAEGRARLEAEQAAQAERDRIQRDHDAALLAERERVAKLEREAAVAQELRVAAERRAERDRQQAQEARKRVEEAQAARDADERHKNQVRHIIKRAFMTCGADEEAAKKIVLTIEAKTVPHVGITF